MLERSEVSRFGEMNEFVLDAGRKTFVILRVESLIIPLGDIRESGKLGCISGNLVVLLHY